jgi:hypothetical protein
MTHISAPCYEEDFVTNLIAIGEKQSQARKLYFITLVCFVPRNDEYFRTLLKNKAFLTDIYLTCNYEYPVTNVIAIEEKQSQAREIVL